MEWLPQALWYEPADLGFNAVVIGPSAFLTGPIVPWAVAFRFTTVVLFVFQTGASIVTLRGRALDQDGLTFLESTAQAVPSIGPGGSVAWISDFNPRSSNTVGGPSLSDPPRLLGSAYFQFDVLNNDAANPATVTMRAMLRNLAR